MLFQFREKKYYEVKEVAEKIGEKSGKITKAIQEIERTGIFFFKMDLGGHKIEEEEIEFIKEYLIFKSLKLKPKEIKPLMEKKVNEYKEREQEEKDMEWTKGLKHARWY